MDYHIATILVLLVAAIHLAIATIEMFFWTNPAIYGRLKRFAFTAEEAKKVAPIVANAGLYNGFIGAGLLWAMLLGPSGTNTQIFFLLCIVIAGIFGAISLRPTTLVLQSVPAAISIVLMLFNSSK